MTGIDKVASIRGDRPRLEIGEQNHPSAARAAVRLVELNVRAEEAAEKLRMSGENERNHPSEAKALVLLLNLAARLKSCPFKTAAQLEFFRSL